MTEDKMRSCCKLKLGFHPFPQRGGTEDRQDPLCDRFQSEMYIFPDQTRKEPTKLPLMKSLQRKTQENYFSQEESNFKSFPPANLPNERIIPGFPNTEIEKDCEEKQKWLQKFKERNAEDVVIQKLSVCFNQIDEEGFMVHPYNSETYLWPLKEKAKKNKRNLAKTKNCDPMSLPLSELELKISDCLGFGLRSIHECFDLDLDSYVEKLRTTAVSRCGLVSKYSDEYELAKEVYRHENNGGEKIRNHVTNVFYQSELQARNFEADLLIVLEKPKLIVNVEIKSAKECSFKNTIQNAAKQLEIRNKTFVACHQEILDEDWSFVRVIAVPAIVDKHVKLSAKDASNICCESCNHFILDWTALNSIEEWIENNLLVSALRVNQKSSYEKLCTRIIGFMSTSQALSINISLGFPDTRSIFEKAVTGRAFGVSSEFNSEEKIQKDPEELKMKDLTGVKHLSSLAVLCYWNPSQLSFLLKSPKRVLFDADFGVGKSLIMKYSACELAKKLKTKCLEEKVFYISAAAAKSQDRLNSNKEANPSLRCPAIFDVANEIDFEETGVQALSISQLITEDDRFEFISDVLIKFMKQHPSDHFFIDELPSTSYFLKGVFCKPLDIMKLQEECKYLDSKSTIWLVMRPVQIDLYDRYIEGLNAYKTTMKENGFIIPDLYHNMRNSSNVIKTCDSLYHQGGVPKKQFDYKTKKYKIHSNSVNGKEQLTKERVKLSVTKALLPDNTVAGDIPVIIPIPYRAKLCVSDTIPYIIETYFKDPAEPVVILVERTREIGKVVNYCEKYKVRRKVFLYTTKEKDLPKKALLKDFLRSPKGILITDADTFGGMQARNIIVLAHDSIVVRNFILRCTSFLIFVQNDKELIKEIVRNSDIKIDKHFLNDKDKFQFENSSKTEIWLWHLPFGTCDDDIKNHVEENHPTCSSLKIEKMLQENVHIGFKLTVPAENYFKLLDVEGWFWPPGWSARSYKANLFTKYQIPNTKMEYNMEPDTIFIGIDNRIDNRESITEDDVRIYAKKKSIKAAKVEKMIEPYKNTQYISFIVKVDTLDYRSVIKKSFWSGMKGFDRVRIFSKNDVKSNK